MSKPYIHSFAFFFLFFLAGSFPIQGQVNSNLNWYFGSNELGIRFNRGTLTPTLVDNPAATFGNGGGAVASDPINGNVLFYTDGSVIYDVTGTQMPNGFGLSVNTSGNQAAATSAKPGQPGQYYVFTNTADFTTGGIIHVTTVDMTLMGNSTAPAPALGDVTGPKSVPIPGLNNRSEAMTLIPHENGTDYWLVTHENGTANYSVTLIDASGTFPTTVYQNVGFAMSAGNFAYNAEAGQIAVSPQSANVGVHVLNFDNATGEITFEQTIPNSAQTGTTDEAIYDVEWSMNGQYLYVSVAGEAGAPGDVLQYDFLNPGTSLASVLPQPNSIAHSYGLQMGPDSVIYHLYQETNGGPILLGALTNTDTVAAAVVYQQEVFPGNFGGTQFPSFLPAADQSITVDFTSSGTCANSPVSFFPEVDPAADSLVWSFGDGNGSNSWSPIHTYENGGTFDVTLTAWLNGESESVTHPIDITQFDLQITLVQDTTACSCELPFPKAPNPKPPCGQFTVTAQVQGQGDAVWSNGQTGLTLTPDSAGYYYVVVTDPNTGCAAYAGVNIREYDVQDQRANIWYFGQNAGLDFNPLPDDPVVSITGPIDSPEGVSVISDRNGQVVFSTDGLNVYDKNGNLVPTPPNPPGLGGEPGATQSVLIMPVPGDETLYYIFTTQEVYGTGTYELRYSLYDLKLNNGDGGLVEYNQFLFSPSTERITGSGNWIIAHEYGNNSFRAYEITTAGISSPVISGAGSDHSVTSAESAQGYMKLGPGNKLAVALSTPGSNVIEIFDFNDSTGVVSNPQVVDLEQPDGQVYGIEFSPGGNKLFATVKGSDSELYEFAFDSLGNAYLKQSESRPGEELGALQMGPDGQIYLAVNGSSFLYTITASEDTASVTPLVWQEFPLQGGTSSTLGLPNFIQNISSPIQGPTISANGFCLGSVTEFNGGGRDPNIETYSWNFGDGQGTPFSNDPSAEHTYANAGTYQVALTLRNRCDVDTVLNTTVVITAPPDDPTFLPDGVFPVLCDGPLTLEATPATNPDVDDLIFVWSTGDSTRTIEVTQQATYSVTIIDAQGCSSSGAILIADNRPIVELGPDLTLCQNSPVAPLDAQNPGATYQWSIDGVNAGTSQTQAVNTSVPGTFEYRVAVTDPITSCTVTDSITYTVNQSPIFTATPFKTSSCGADDGRIELNVDAPASSVFTYSITGPSATTVTDQPANPSPAAPFSVTPLAPGTYGVTVTDQVTGCATTTTTSINDDAFDVDVAIVGTCDPITLSVSTDNPPQASVSYRVIDDETALVVDSGSGMPGANFTTIALPSDSRRYVVEVTSDGSGCVQSSMPVFVNQNDEVPVTINADVCSDPITLTASGGTSWSWTGPNITGSATGSSITATPPQGTQVYNLHVEQAGFCDLDTAITVNVDNTIVPTLTQSDACADQVVLTVTPSGPYLYRWYRNGSLDNSLAGPQAVITDANDGDEYMVQVFNPATGCTGDSPALTASVVGSLELSLDVGQACEGNPFVITGTTNVPVGSYQWSYEGSVINGETSSTLEDTREGVYEATVTLSSCTAVEEIQVLLSPVTAGSLPSSAIICNDPANTDPETSQVVLDPGAGFSSYAWFRDGVALGITDQTLTATEPGEYTVDLVNSFGCPSTDQAVVEIECIPKIVAPNAFRPGGLNTDFFMYTFFIDDTDFEVLIFSRWGELVFQSTDREFHWNGGYNNSPAKPLPPGTYAYLVKYKSSYQPERGVQEKRGGVVLLR